MRNGQGTGEPDQSSTEGVRKAAPPSALFGWVLFDWAAQPFYTLIVTFLFAPYFVSAVVGDPVRGQALWGYAAAVAGIAIAIGSPLFGALADRRGGRKLWIALFCLVAAAAMSCLWLAVPNANDTTLFLLLVAFVVGTAAVEFTTVFINAIMPTLVPKAQVGRLSGIGWGVGYVGGVLSLFVMAGLIVTSPATGKTLLGLDALIPLDTVAREGDRLVGPFSALWLLVFAIPFFVFTPDRRTVAHAGPELSAFASLWATIKELPSHPGVLIFLIARMVYIDGLTAIFTFGGIYGAAVFGWGAFELGLFGITLAVMGAIGAVIGGVLDDRIGAKWVIVGALVLLLVAATGILSVDKTHVLFSISVAPKAAQSAAFSSVGEQVYLAFACLVGLVAAPVQAASRSLLARLAPADQMTQFFGLFAFSGKVTAFAAPMLVALVTTVSGSQRAGVAVIAVFLVLGLLLMFAVRVNEFRNAE